MSGVRSDISWWLELDPSEWLVVPTTGDVGWRAEAIHRVRRDLDDREESDAPPEDVRDDDIAERAVDGLLAFAATMAADGLTVAAVGVPERTPVPVVVTVAVIDEHDPVDLLEVCGARAGASFDAPEVEYLDLDAGDGIRVTRVDVDTAAVARMSVCLGVRSELADTVIRWRSTDIAIVAEMTERLDRLLAGVRIDAGTRNDAGTEDQRT